MSTSRLDRMAANRARRAERAADKRAVAFGELACWRKGPGGIWLVWGRFDLLFASLDGDGPVKVRDRQGDIVDVYLERVTKPNYEGFAYGWPMGTKASSTATERIEPVPGRTTRSQAIRNRARQRATFRRRKQS